jgi:hypothetical protein
MENTQNPICCGSACCEDDCGCTEMKAKRQPLIVDFLYLDLKTCERCMATDGTLDEAMEELMPLLNTLGFAVAVNKVNIRTAAMAEQYRFLSSPTIRVNGADICRDVKENACQSCGDICGADTQCRVFVHDGAEYDQPPKAMIVEGVLKSLYAPRIETDDGPYILPENLSTFFAGVESDCCEDCDADNGKCCV